MKCNKCGNELNEDNIFCTNCGNKIHKHFKWKINNKKIKLIIASVIIIILIILTIYIKNNYQSHNTRNQNKENNIIVTEMEKKDNLAIDILKNGDYVEYIDSSGNTIICRVLYDNNSEYGLQIISDKSVCLMSLSRTNQEQRR